MAPRTGRHYWAIALVLLLVLLMALSACERQLQDQGENVIPGAGATAEVEQPTASETEESVVGAPVEEPTTEVEGEEPAAEEPTAEAPTEEPTEVVVEEVAATEESPRPAEETPGAEETAESVEVVATEEPAEATAEAEAPEEDEAETAGEETAAAEAQVTATATAAPAATEERVHVVQAGENLYRIGLQYGISWVVLADYNNLPNANAIYVGQELKIPPDPNAPGDTTTPTPTPPTETTYTVQAGDNLYRIGRLYNLSWVEIAEANGLVNPNWIYVGQVLKIPATGSTPAQITHTVQPNETLFLISLHYGVPWMTIASANNLRAPYVIYSGQTLVIPAGG